MLKDIIKNPFKGIIKTDIAPHNRTLRTDFLRKLKDAFVVFYGAACKGKMGILDYCALGIPFAIHQFASELMDRDRDSWIGCGLAILVILWNIVKALIAGILVFNPVSLIVTGAVQLIAWYGAGGRELQQQALSLLLTNEKEEKITLKNELLAPPDYDRFIINKEWKKTDFSPEMLRIQFNEKKSQLVVMQAIFSPGCNSNDKKYYGGNFCYLPVFQNGKIIKHGENIAALKALIKLNVGNVTENLEKTKEGRELLNNIMAAPAA